jgi:hypothetical protein
VACGFARYLAASGAAAEVPRPGCQKPAGTGMCLMSSPVRRSPHDRRWQDLQHPDADQVRAKLDSTNDSASGNPSA